ncbi:TrbC/VirB2 family protein [Ectobacillus polymachus]|uniref:TrbC/VirB2 family protein n=1 Tax=Ectobacillus polymachus TaxID=1508806 RepID=UPI003A881732
MKRWRFVLFIPLLLLIPEHAFAINDDPTTIVKNVANGMINFFMIIAPSIGTAAIMALGIMYILTNSSGKKSEYKSNMKDIFIVVAIVMCAGILMKWFLGLLG